MKDDINWDHWGQLAERYRETRPRRMLAFDGGGIRGLLTMQVLVRLEQVLAKSYEARGMCKKEDFRLCQFFDYVGGTSTGAVIAAAVAIGMPAADILGFYEAFGNEVFTKRKWYERWKSLYDNGVLQQKLQEIYDQGVTSGHRTLEPEHLRTLLLTVTRNATTDSAWPISSNPSARYNDPARDNCNLRIPLWQLVRASTAAPAYFPPEVVQWGKDESQAFVFVDGGTTPYNNPAFLMTRMATEPAYKLNWRRGEQDLLVVSLGTGTAPVVGTTADDPESNLLAAAVNTLGAVMGQAQTDQDLNCRTVGRCSYGRFLDREVGDLVPRDSDGKALPLSEDLHRAFLYVRYDVELTEQGLETVGIRNVDPEPLRALDSTDAMDELKRVGEAVADQVDLAHLGGFIDQPLYMG
jgi:predicted acylesterase/phospholipase RssA